VPAAIRRLLVATIAFSVALFTLAHPVPIRAADTTWTVNSTADSGGPCSAICTLRSAIAAANASAGGDLIVFSIAPSGPKVINVGAGSVNPLPTVTGNDISIDGSTQPGGGARGITLRDVDGSGETGLTVDGDRVTIRGLSFTRWDSNGIYLRASAQNAVVQGNWIGTTTGTTDESQTGDAIRITQGGGHLIGGPNPGEGNLISGGNSDGIDIDTSSDNVVSGNIIGLTADGISRLANSGSGVRIVGASYRNRIGGLLPAERNVISANGSWGVYLTGVMSSGSCTGPQENVVQGNWVGPNVSGQLPPGTQVRSNGADNVYLRYCARNNLIGGAAQGARNVLSGSQHDGVEIDSLGGPGGLLGSCNNVVQGNYIGSDPTGMTPIPNHDDGVAIDNGSCSNQVGGLNPGEGNLIGGNYNDGVELSRPYSTNNSVLGNVIGLAADGSTPLRNSQHGVNIRYKADHNLVEGNVISANLLNGVYINQHLSWYNVIRNNKIGTNVAGTAARGNKMNGVQIFDGARYNLIEGNLIRGNTLDGINVERVAGSIYTTRFNVITRNSIRNNGGLGIDLLPADGPNANDGAWSDAYGNRGIDHPVITAATTVSARGTAPAFTTVEVFGAIVDAGETAGEGATYLGTVTASGSGAWCLSGFSTTAVSLTGTSTDSAANTSEFSPNLAVAGSVNVCAPPPPPPPPPSFEDTFTAPDGSAPTNWSVRRSAAGAGAGASIQGNALVFNVSLTDTQNGSWQYVQAREVPYLPDWSASTQVIGWQMSTAANTNQTSNMILTPTAVTTNATATPDALRLRVMNGQMHLFRAVGGVQTLLWSGPVPVTTDLRAFELRIDGTNVALSEGPIGGLAVRTSGIAHGLSWTSGHIFLNGSSNAVAPFAPRFDTVTAGPQP